MTGLTQKWCLVALLEATEVGDEFDKSEWPLHITFAGVHDADWKNPALVEELAKVLAPYKPFQTKALNIGNLGPSNKPTRVTFIEMNEEVTKLHNDLMKLLEDKEAVFSNPEFQNQGFVAHSTVQKNHQVNEGEDVEINNLALIDMFPNFNSDRRTVTKIINLD